jgi:hypothetical protein
MRMVFRVLFTGMLFSMTFSLQAQQMPKSFSEDPVKITIKKKDVISLTTSMKNIG